MAYMKKRTGSAGSARDSPEPRLRPRVSPERGLQSTLSNMPTNARLADVGSKVGGWFSNLASKLKSPAGAEPYIALPRQSFEVDERAEDDDVFQPGGAGNGVPRSGRVFGNRREPVPVAKPSPSNLFDDI